MPHEEQIQIPTSWLQRMSRREALALLTFAIGVGVWGYSLNGDVVTLKDRLARTEAKLELMDKEFQKRDKDMSITLATLGVSLMTIDRRLTSIETNVRRIAQ